MSYKNFSSGIAVLLLAGLFSVNASAATAGLGHDYVFNFTAECDDCLFDENQNGLVLGDEGFQLLNDELTQAVTGTLRFTNVILSEDGLIKPKPVTDELLISNLIFTYDGSSLLNPFIAQSDFFEGTLTPTGEIGPTFTDFSVTGTNAGDPLAGTDVAAPIFRPFENLCTELGQQVLGAAACNRIFAVTFSLNNSGEFSISSFGLAFDIGSSGQLTPTSVNPVPLPAAAWLFGSALLGFIGFSRRKLKNIN